MSSSSNSRTARRRFCLALAAWPLAGLADMAPESPVAGMRRWGSGRFRRFGFHVYDATLWSLGDDPTRPPLALRLTYQRHIAGRDIADASVREMRRFTADEARLKDWGETMRGLFPDVRPGDALLGIHWPGLASFHLNGREIGRVADPEFARHFFAIWLDPRTSAPDLREALLKRDAGAS